MRCSDGQFYVVKFLNNPQHLRVLTNEMFATRLAERVGLPVPVTQVVEVGEWLIEHTPELHVQLAHNDMPKQLPNGLPSRKNAALLVPVLLCAYK